MSEKPIQDVPEVEALVAAERELQEFINQHRDIYDTLQRLVETRNTQLEAAEKVVRAQGVSCGPFELLSQVTKVNAEKLFEELGEDNYQEVGGSVEYSPTYKIDIKKFHARVACGDIPQEVAADVTKVERRYRRLDPYKIP